MKQRLLFAIHYLELGGAEMSLIGLLHALDYSRYNVDLFVYSHRGELMRFIPKEVRLLPEIPAYACIERPMKDALLKGHFRVVCGRLKAKWQHHLKQKGKGTKQDASIFQYVMNGVEPWLPSLEHLGEYDLAVSFLAPHNIVLSKVRAKKKACWIHTDYSRISVNAALELPVWGGYDHIVSISPDVTREFLGVFPTLAGRIVEIHNILPTAFVRGRAKEMSAEEVEEEMPREAGTINLLSVGRFTHAKNYDNVPVICKLTNYQLSILNSPFRARWYLIGYGGDEALIRQRIGEAGMQGLVVILGKKANPYPYIKACDVYVQPSRYEGNAVTVREAQMLGKSVVVTDYATAASQVKDGTDGVIVPMDNEGCARGIAAFIAGKQKQQAIADHLATHDYSNVAEAEKLCKLL